MGGAISMPNADVNGNEDIGSLRYGCGQDLGRKSKQEDMSWARVLASPRRIDDKERSLNVRGFFVVCDGHGGADAAEFTSQNLLKFFLLEKELDVDCGRAMRSAILKADEEFDRQVKIGNRKESGTTALAMAVFGSKVVIANVGDCRALLSCKGTAKTLTTDHRPDKGSERERIEAAGGFVDCEGYVCGELGVSRAIGDHQYRNLKTDDGTGPLIADPEITEHIIEDDDEFIVVVSDGVTDGLTNQTIIDLVRNSLRERNNPEQASKAVVSAAFETGVKDNLTAMTVCFKPDPPAKKRLATSPSRIRIDQKSESFADLLKAVHSSCT